MDSNSNSERQNQNAFDSDESKVVNSSELDYYEFSSSGESATEYEDGTSTYTVSIESPGVNQRKIIHADYDALIGDLDIPDFAGQTLPYHLQNQPGYQSICSGLSAESLKYFQLGNRRRTVSGAVIRNLSSDFEGLAQPSPNLGLEAYVKLENLEIPWPAYGVQEKCLRQVGNSGISHISNPTDSSYGSQLYLRRKTLPRPHVQPPLTRAATERDQRRSSQDNNNSCIIV